MSDLEEQKAEIEKETTNARISVLAWVNLQIEHATEEHAWTTLKALSRKLQYLMAHELFFAGKGTAYDMLIPPDLLRTPPLIDS